MRVLKWGAVASLAVAATLRFALSDFARSAALFSAACLFLVVSREIEDREP